jgi:dephospho-CoA kinase
MPSEKLSNVWGLTGGIASGKSTVARIFSELGIPVVDADQVARQLAAKGGAAHLPILDRFGTTDRSSLREIVFSDPQARKDLEAILHPLIKAESERQLQKLGPGVVLYEAALLVETGRYKDFRGLIVVDAPREQRKQRLIERDHCSPELAEKILLAQSSDENRRAAATFVLENSGTEQELRAKIELLAQELRKQV